MVLGAGNSAGQQGTIGQVLWLLRYGASKRESLASELIKIKAKAGGFACCSSFQWQKTASKEAIFWRDINPPPVERGAATALGRAAE